MLELGCQEWGSSRPVQAAATNQPAHACRKAAADHSAATAMLGWAVTKQSHACSSPARSVRPARDGSMRPPPASSPSDRIIHAAGALETDLKYKILRMRDTPGRRPALPDVCQRPRSSALSRRPLAAAAATRGTEGGLTLEGSTVRRHERAELPYLVKRESSWASKGLVQGCQRHRVEGGAAAWAMACRAEHAGGLVALAVLPGTPRAAS